MEGQEKLSRFPSLCMVFLISLLLIIPFSYATLDCEGEGQIFFVPEILEKETISIPCSLTTPYTINATCLGMLLFEDDLISVSPEIKDVGLFGITSYIEVIDGGHLSESFVVTFRNRDLLHLTDFSWQVICVDINGTIYNSFGNITTEIPFAEPVVRKSIAYFQRDKGQLIGLFFVILAIFIVAGILIKLVLNKK